MFKSFTGWAGASVLGCVAQDSVYVGCDIFDILGVDRGAGLRGHLWWVGVMLEELWEFVLDLLLVRKLSGEPDYVVHPRLPSRLLALPHLQTGCP